MFQLRGSDIFGFLIVAVAALQQPQKGSLYYRGAGGLT